MAVAHVQDRARALGSDASEGVTTSAMALRRLPPAHSPISARALFAGLRSALSGDATALGEVRKSLRHRLDADEVLLTDSGTSALALSIRTAVECQEGPVAIPAFGCYDLATAAATADVETVLYDLDPHSLAPRGSSLVDALEAGAGAVVLVPLYGVPVDMEAPLSLARGAASLLIEDVAQGLGASWRGRPLGSLGDFSVLSFGRGKGLTGGGGGALAVSDASSAGTVTARGDMNVVRAGWKELAGAAGQWAFSHPRLYSLPASVPFLGLGETVYEEPRPAGSMSRAAASIVAVNCRTAETESRSRRENAERLLRIVDSIDGLEPIRPPASSTPGWLRLPVLAASRRQATRLSGDTGRRLGIGTGYPKPLSQLPQLRPRCVNSNARFPGAATLARRLITLPTHGNLRRDDLLRLEQHLRSCESWA